MSSIDMTIESSTVVTATHQSAETRFRDADGVRFAFRRFGRSGATPLVMLQHFRGNLDSWDPALTDALAGEREVILVDYPGVSSSSGAFGPTIADTARRMIAFLAALDLSEVDLVGFSIGGFVGQEIALIRPALVRRLVLAATGPKGGPGMHGWVEDIADAARLEQGTAESLLHIFFAPTETQPRQGPRVPLALHGAPRGPRPAEQSRRARCPIRRDRRVGIPDHGALQRLSAIRCPTLIIQGDRDRMIPTGLSHLMAGLIPDAQIRIYPDSAHAFLFQEPDQVAADINAFLLVEGAASH